MMRTSTFAQASSAHSSPRSPRRPNDTSTFLVRATNTFSTLGDTLSPDRSIQGLSPRDTRRAADSLVLTAAAWLNSGRTSSSAASVAKYHYDKPRLETDLPPPPGSIASGRGEYRPLHLEKADTADLRARAAAEKERLAAEEQAASSWFDEYTARKAMMEQQQKQQELLDRVAAEKVAIKREEDRREAARRHDRELKERRARLALERDAVEKMLTKQKVEFDRMKHEAEEAGKAARRERKAVGTTAGGGG
jgi:hypothetical protein